MAGVSPEKNVQPEVSQQQQPNNDKIPPPEVTDEVADLSLQLESRKNPTAKSVLRDIILVNKVLATTKTGLQSVIGSKFDAVSTLFTTSSNNLAQRITSIEDKCDTLDKKCFQNEDSLEKRLQISEQKITALEHKLKKVNEADNIVLQTDPAIEAKQAAHENQLLVTKNILSCMEKDIASNSTRGMANTARLLSNNVKISGIPFSPSEDPVSVVKKFLEDKVEISVNNDDIYDAFRLPGTLSVFISGIRVTLPPQMFVRCSPSLRRRIEKNKRNLEGKTDPIDHHFYKIKAQLPDSYSAARQHFNPIVQDIITKNEGKEPRDQDTFAFRGAELLINGCPVKEAVAPPPRTDLLGITAENQSELNKIPLPVLASVTEKKSRFFGFAVRAYSTKYIQEVYLRLRQLHPTANHIMLAYRVDCVEDISQILQGSCHDGESHGDVKLADVLLKSQMSNVAVFVVRYYGGIQLRGARLKHIADVGRNALNKLRFPDGVPPGQQQQEAAANSETAPTASQMETPASPSQGGSRDTGPPHHQNTDDKDKDDDHISTEEGECNSIHSGNNFPTLMDHHNYGASSFNNRSGWGRGGHNQTDHRNDWSSYYRENYSNYNTDSNREPYNNRFSQRGGFNHGYDGYRERRYRPNPDYSHRGSDVDDFQGSRPNSRHRRPLHSGPRRQYFPKKNRNTDSARMAYTY